MKRTFAGQLDPLGFCADMDPRLVAGTLANVSVINRAHYLRVMFGGPCVATKIGITVGVSSGNICLSVHSNSGSGRAAVPGARTATTGSIACPAPGYAEPALLASVAVRPGDWLAISADNTTATFACVANNASNLLAGLASHQDSAFPIPATPSSLLGPANRGILLIAVP